MDAAAGPPRFTAPELARFLLAPDAGEQLSPVGGDGATGPAGLVLDLRASSEAEAAEAHAVLVEQLEARERELGAERTVLTHLGDEMSKARGSVKYQTADDGLRLKL